MFKFIFLIIGLFAATVNALEVNVYEDSLGDTYSVSMVGDVDFGDAERLTDATRGLKISKIFVRSYGGYVDAGIETAAVIREMDVPVIAFQWCQSACTFLLSAGSEQFLSSGTKVGFHCPYYTISGFVFQLTSGGPAWFDIYNTFKAGLKDDALAALWISTTYGTASRDMFIVSDHNASLYGIKVL